MNLRLTVESSRGEILPLLVLKFPKWLKSRLKTRALEVSINGAESFGKRVIKSGRRQEKEKNSDSLFVNETRKYEPVPD